MTKRYDPVATAVDKMVPYQEQGISLDDLRRVLPKGRDKEINRFVSFFQSGDKERKQGPSIDGIPRYQHYLDGMINLVIDVETSRASKTGEIEGRGAFVYNIIKFDSRFAARMKIRPRKWFIRTTAERRSSRLCLFQLSTFPIIQSVSLPSRKGFIVSTMKLSDPLKVPSTDALGREDTHSFLESFRGSVFLASPALAALFKPVQQQSKADRRLKMISPAASAKEGLISCPLTLSCPCSRSKRRVGEFWSRLTSCSKSGVNTSRCFSAQ